MSGQCSLKLDFSELYALEKKLGRVGGDVAKKAVNKAAGKAATKVGKSIRSNAPTGKTRQLKKGFKRKKERSKVANKAVYQYAMDSAKNDLFQKPIKNPGKYGGKHKYWGYYPNSVEYGFLTKAKGGGLQYHRIGRRFRKTDNSWRLTSNQIDIVGTTRHHYKAVETVKGQASRKVEGQHFVKKAAEQAQPQVHETIKRELFSELDKEWKK